jgi:hypothetical protein
MDLHLSSSTHFYALLSFATNNETMLPLRVDFPNPRIRQFEPTLSLLVQTGSEVGADEGGCSPMRARARCACGMSRIRPAVSPPATPAIAAKQVRGTAADDVGVADEATGCASGESRVSCLVRGEPCIHIRTGIRRRGA